MKCGDPTQSRFQYHGGGGRKLTDAEIVFITNVDHRSKPNVDNLDNDDEEDDEIICRPSSRQILFEQLFYRGPVCLQKYKDCPQAECNLSKETGRGVF